MQLQTACRNVEITASLLLRQGQQIVIHGYMSRLDIFVLWVIQNLIGVMRHNPTRVLLADLYPGQEAGSWVVRVQLMAFSMSVGNLRILILGLNLVVPVGLGMMFCLISSAQKNGMALMQVGSGEKRVLFLYNLLA